MYVSSLSIEYKFTYLLSNVKLKIQLYSVMSLLQVFDSIIRSTGKEDAELYTVIFMPSVKWYDKGF